MTKQIFIFFIIITSVISHCFAKPFYLTVKRDFSENENPQLELNYMYKAPIFIKILEPIDKKSFVAQQIDLRRAWKKPDYQFNPAHFLNLGLSQDNDTFDWLRKNINITIKKPNQKNLGGSQFTPNLSPLKLGPEKIIQIPSGFKLFRELVLNPEENDSKKEFDVPGFEMFNEQYGYGTSLKTKIVSLPKLQSGLYLLQVIQGNDEGQVVLSINEIRSLMQRSHDQLIYRVSNRQSEPISGATVSLRNISGEWVAERKTDSNGEVTFTGIKDNDILSMVQYSNGISFIDSEYFSTAVSFPDLFLYTDRPLYRDGDIVSFKGILRNFEGGTSKLDLSSKDVKIEIINISEGKVSTVIDSKLTEFGTFSGTVQIKGAESSGIYRIVAKLNKYEHSSEIRVKEYVKPIYFLKVNSDVETARPGDSLKIRVQAERYAGGAPKITNASAYLRRQRIDSSQWIEDAGLGETGSTTTYGDDPNADKKVLAPETIGSPIKIIFDEKGYSNFEITIPKDLEGPKNINYSYKVEVESFDSDDNIVYGSKIFFDLASEVTSRIRFNKVLSESTNDLELTILSRNVSGKIYSESSGDVNFEIKDANGVVTKIGSAKVLTNGSGSAKIKVPETKLIGELKAIVTLFDKKGNPSSSIAETLVVGNTPGVAATQTDDLKFYSNQTEVSPSEFIKVYGLLPDGWGAKNTNKGKVYITIAGLKIFSTKIMNVEGRSFWIKENMIPEYGNQIYFVISYSDSKKGWIEKRLSFRILDPEKKLNVIWVSRDESVTPGSEQRIKFKVVDNNGKAVKSEVSLSVVDQSVLDIQPELRPKLTEFFYPLIRLDLSSFYSSHFQGYGYGERIAKLFNANHTLAAAKNQSKPMDIKDTAYWNAHLVTNERGEIDVKFPMPGNQTIWKVTAVIVDKQGRFGESTTKFKSHLPISLTVGYPPFVRSDDQARFRVSINGQDVTQATKVTYNVNLESNKFLNLTNKAGIAVELKSKEQISANINFSTNLVSNSNSTNFIGNLEFNKSKLSFKDQIKILPMGSLIKEFKEMPNNQIKIAENESQRIQNAEIFLYNDFASVLIANLNWMTQYPYGCVEQTLSTTIPNKIVYDILNSAKNKGLKLAKEHEEILKTAQINAELGFKKLSQFQMENGGFKWFQESSEPDVNMSLLVMLNLSLLDSTGIISYYNFRPTYDWLTTKNIVVASPQGIAMLYIEALLANKYIVNIPEKDFKARFNVAFEYVKNGGSVLEKSLLIMALLKTNFAKKEMPKEFDQIISALKKELTESLSSSSVNNTKNLSIDLNSWQSYPGKSQSALALGYRSLFEAETFFNVPKNLKKNKINPLLRTVYLTDDLKSNLKKSILFYFNGNNFGSTFDNTIVLSTLPVLMENEILAFKDINNPIKSLKIKIDGKELTSNQYSMTNYLGSVGVKIEDIGLVKNGKVILVNEIIPNQIAKIRIEKFPEPHAVESSNNKWQIKRDFYLLKTDGSKEKLVSGQKIKIGDLVYTEISFTNPKQTNLWRSRYYVLVNDTAAGLQPIQEDQLYTSSPYNLSLRAGAQIRDILNHETRWYFDFSRGWMDKASVVGQVYRASYSGKFSAGIAKIEDFYDETQNSYSSHDFITIESDR